MLAPMAVSAGERFLDKEKTGKVRPSPFSPVFLLTLVAVTTSSLSALSLYQLMVLRAEVEGLKSEVGHRREEGQFKVKCEEQSETMNFRRNQAEVQQAFSQTRKRRMVTEPQTFVSQSCLHLLADNSRETYSKEFDSEPHTGIPWQTGLIRGSSLEREGDAIIVKEEGFYFVYSQVYYIDRTFAMGHLVIRKKKNKVGDEPQYVTLFRCIQSMNTAHPYNTCYTGGVAKLEVGDHLELLVPRRTANVSMDGDATFLGAFKLV